MIKIKKNGYKLSTFSLDDDRDISLFIERKWDDRIDNCDYRIGSGKKVAYASISKKKLIELILDNADYIRGKEGEISKFKEKYYD